MKYEITVMKVDWITSEIEARYEDEAYELAEDCMWNGDFDDGVDDVQYELYNVEEIYG